MAEREVKKFESCLSLAGKGWNKRSEKLVLQNYKIFNEFFCNIYLSQNAETIKLITSNQSHEWNVIYKHRDRK